MLLKSKESKGALISHLAELVLLYSNTFIAKSGAQSLTFKSVTNKQTDKKLNVFGHPGGGSNLNPTKLDMVIEDREHVLAPPKLLEV